jgi:hypothetical protein
MGQRQGLSLDCFHGTGHCEIAVVQDCAGLVARQQEAAIVISTVHVTFQQHRHLVLDGSRVLGRVRHHQPPNGL